MYDGYACSTYTGFSSLLQIYCSYLEWIYSNHCLNLRSYRLQLFIHCNKPQHRRITEHDSPEKWLIIDFLVLNRIIFQRWVRWVKQIQIPAGVSMASKLTAEDNSTFNILNSRSICMLSSTELLCQGSAYQTKLLTKHHLFFTTRTCLRDVTIQRPNVSFRVKWLIKGNLILHLLLS